MVWFWKPLLFVVLSSTSIMRVDSSHLMKTEDDSVPKVNQLSECLSFISHDLSLAFVTNIRIRIEAESILLRREFMSIVERFIASNDKLAIDLSSEEGHSYNIHIRLYFIDSLKSLELLINQQRKQDSDLSGVRQYYLIVLPINIPNPGRVLKKVFQFCWESSILNVNVMVEDKNGIVTLFTYYPFTQQSCQDRTPIVQNRFINGSLELKKKTFPSKTSNLWQCRVRMILYNDPPYVTINRERLYGIDVNTLTSLAEIMNFTLEIIAISVEEWGQVYSSSNFTGGYKMIKAGMADLIIAICDSKRHAFLASTNAYTLNEIRLIVKRAKTYTPLEILLFPFDGYTWLGISILYVGKQISQLIRKRATNSLVSLSDVFIRLCLTLWLMSILILKSSYEGSIFKFLNKRPDRDPPKSLDDAINRGYTFIVSAGNHDSVYKIPELRNKLIKFGDSESEALEYFDRLEGNYGIFLFQEQLMVQTNSARYRNYIVVQEHVLASRICVYLRQFSYLTVEFNKRMQELHTYGHMLKNDNDAMPRGPSLMKKRISGDPESMSLESLMGALELLFISNGLSACVFIVEIFSRRNRTLRVIMEVFH